ncbi:hypothetical protein N0V82_007193 [Gnomoniopsis sp. IMI 355080]|nr:hypothetical protein N0V82_007193 [Gnomoniopsis sp. IMI 355080]
MAALNQELRQTQRTEAHEIVSQESLFHQNQDSANSGYLAFSESLDQSLRVSHVDVPTTGRTAKRQPWQAVWPAPREPVSQANIFGFKKGEVMVFDGNAGNFFARDAWVIEQEVHNSTKQEANTAPLA